ncbi:amino acid transporter [Kitasatospora sp. MAP12-15]|uniref:APC family permease n=1 Tax=unclassified Kitasatospora TaxID=2633591 RepID=UPI0024740B0E|nr:APC family permease [Kitasatospora sp. MAP12-44]MDH6113796.1 amino acid transporter [Kitasatospora sp. MAP12-44]
MSTPHSSGGRTGLRANVLGTFDTIVMAVAGSAPAYSLAATTATLAGAAGLFSPAALLWCAIPMLGIAWAFNYLGRIDVNAGASYSWVGRALHPSLGFMSGWALVVSATLFMVAGSLPAGSYTLSLFSASLANNTALATAVGAGWFLVMAALVLMGARITAHAQWIMTGIEIVILVVFGVAALVHGGGAAVFSWSWLWGFGHFGGVKGFAASALIAAFYFWGWDVTANLSEETSNSKRNAGLGGLLGVVTAFAIFEVVTISVNLLISQNDIQTNSSTLLSDIGEIVWPGWGGKVLVVAVVLSTIATLETTLIQVSRSLFAMGRDRTVPAVFGKSHLRWQTPWVAIAVVSVVSLLLFIGSNAIGSVNTILTAAINAIGLQIAFYYALAGLAVVVAYRRLLLKSVSNAIFIGIWPLAGALFMGFVFVEALFNFTGLQLGLGLGTLALGLIPMAWYWTKGSSYYRPARLDATDADEIEARYGGSDLALSGAESGLATDL